MIVTRSTNQMSQGDSPPFSNERSEKGALSCILQEAEQIVGGGVEILNQLTATDFYGLPNRSIFKKLKDLRDKGEPLDTPNLIKHRGDDVDIPYAVGLVNEAPSPLQFPVYLKNLKAASIRRKLRVICQEGLKLSSDSSQSMEGILMEFQGEIQKATQDSPMSSALPPIEEFEEFAARDIPKPPVLIKDLLHQGSKMLVSGASKSHKTFMLMDLALSVAGGTPFLGLPTTQANVLYINLELQSPFAQRRLKAIRKAKDLSEVSGMKIWNLRGHACDIRLLCQQTGPQIQKEDIGLIVIDPIYKTYGDRDENRVSDVTSIMNELEYTCREGSVAVVFATHQTKGNQAGKESIDRISGSGAFARDVDSGLIFTAHNEEGCYTMEASILRNFPPFNPFVIRWEYPIMVREDDLNPEHLKERRNPNRGKPCTVEQVMAHVPRNEPIDKNFLIEKVKDMGIGMNRTRDLINLAVSEEKLFSHSVKRPGTNDLQRIARYPQEQQEDFHDPHA